MTIVIDFINTPKEAKWRMRSESGETSEWSSYYEGILTHKFKNSLTYGLATDYWNGVLPTWKPFIIIPINQYKTNEITSLIEAEIFLK